MIDLHLHLDGSLAPQDLPRLANLSGTVLPTQDPDALQALLTVEPTCTDLGEYLQKFDLPLQVLQSESALKWAVYRLIERLAQQGLCYAEIRFAPQSHRQKGLDQGQVVAAAVTGLQRGVREFGLPAQLILCCMRGQDNQQENLETLHQAQKWYGRGVCGLDLAGNEAAWPTADYEPLFRQAALSGIPFVLHAGEAAGPQNVWDALHMGARRIGHGIHAVQDPALVAELQRRRIPLELCFTSNLQTRGVHSPADFPLVHFVQAGVPVTVNTDNMTVSGTTLRREYRLLRDQFGLSVQQLEQLALTSADCAMLAPARRAELKARIRRDFAAWLGGMDQ